MHALALVSKTPVPKCMQHSLQKNAHIYITTPIFLRIHMYTNTHAHALHRPHAEALILRLTIYAQIRIHIHIHMCINAYIYIYIHTCIYIYIYMSAHIHTYTYTHTRIQNVHMNAHKARLKRRRGSDGAGSPTWRQEALPSSLSAAIRRGIPFVASSPIARPRGTTDKRRTTTTNSSLSHHRDGAPSRPHPLSCTGAEPIHPVHGLPKLRALPWPPETRSFFCHFWRAFSKSSKPELTLGWQKKSRGDCDPPKKTWLFWVGQTTGRTARKTTLLGWASSSSKNASFSSKMCPCPWG